jgi:hypothetical protein
MASVSRTLERIKDDLEPFVSEESIVAAAHEAGHTWRERILGPVQTVHHFILQVLFCNTAMMAGFKCFSDSRPFGRSITCREARSSLDQGV